MAVAFGNLPYHQRLETMISQPSYHSIDNCGSSFHGLATTIEEKIKKDELVDAIKQIKKCIRSRKDEMRKRSFPDPAHNHAVKVLEKFLRSVTKLHDERYYYAEKLKYALVRFDTEFVITIGDKKIGGGRKQVNTHKRRKTRGKRNHNKTKRRKN